MIFIELFPASSRHQCYWSSESSGDLLSCSWYFPHSSAWSRSPVASSITLQSQQREKDQLPVTWIGPLWGWGPCTVSPWPCPNETTPSPGFIDDTTILSKVYCRHLVCSPPKGQYLPSSKDYVGLFLELSFSQADYQSGLMTSACPGFHFGIVLLESFLTGMMSLPCPFLSLEWSSPRRVACYSYRTQPARRERYWHFVRPFPHADLSG